MNHQPNQSAKKKIIYYDGGCPMCTILVSKVGNSPQKEMFDPKDITKESLLGNFTKEQVEKEIHVVDSDGTVYTSAEAILKIIEEYPRWEFLARIASTYSDFIKSGFR